MPKNPRILNSDLILKSEFQLNSKIQIPIELQNLNSDWIVWIWIPFEFQIQILAEFQILTKFRIQTSNSVALILEIPDSALLISNSDSDSEKKV